MGRMNVCDAIAMLA